jgi:propionyl-CoA carboxylase alpha chain
MPGVRVDAGFAEGTDVSPYYDPMLAKVISHAPSRGEAARLLAQALRRSRIHGVSTNRDLLVRILEHPEFLDGRIDTGFLVRHDPAALGAPLASEEAELLHAQAAALALQASHRASAPVLRPMPSGWRNNPNGPAKVSFEGHHGAIEVEYGFDRSGRSNHLRAVLSAPHSRSATHTPASPESLGAAGVGEGGVGEGGATVLECTPDEVAMEIGGVRTRFEVQQVDGVAYVDSPLGSSVLRVIERFRLPESQGAAGSLAAPLPGTVVKVAVDPGQAVEAGDLLVVIEAMKMEHEVSAPRSGIVSAVRVEQGHQVEPGEVLVVIDAEEGS